jgi:mannosylglycerate hydrolase
MKRLHVISHTHWDREWYLTFQQFRLKLIHLIDKLLDILDEDPDFKHFMLDGQTIVLDDYLQMRPEKEDILREHIQNGRILIGPWHILPDMFLVSSEAHIRNLLEGARTARKFGPKMPVGYIPDPFGYPGQIPQILQGFKLDAASLWRGVSRDKPVEMWWESPDGSRVLLAYLRDSYSNGAALPVSNPSLFAEAISAAGESLAQYSAVKDQLIMLGTDHMEPSPFTSWAIATANEHLLDMEVIHSTYPQYLLAIQEQIDKLEEPIPTIYGELRACDRSHLLPGVLSTRMWIKQRNHKSQILLEKWAEPFSVFAEHMLGRASKEVKWTEKTPQEIAANRIQNVAAIIRQAWRMLMENHPHDSICGCSIDQVHEEMKPRFDQVDQIGEEIIRQSLRALAASVNTDKEGMFSSVVVFNPLGFENQGLVEAEITLPEDMTAIEVVDEQGNVIPHEFIGESNEEYANVLLPENALRDTIGAISEGWVAGSAIIRVKVTRKDHVVTIDALLDDHGPPNINEWRKAEELIARYEDDPSVTHYHVIARSPISSKVRIVSPSIPALGWRTLWLRDVTESNSSPAAEVNPLIRSLLPTALKFSQSQFGMKIITRLETGRVNKPPYMIENEFFQVEASKYDGTLTVRDKRTGIVFEGLNRFVDGSDSGDEYNYAPLEFDAFYSPKLVSIRALPEGLTPSLEIKLNFNIPAKLSSDRKKRSEGLVIVPIVSRIMLTPEVPRIDVQTEIDNQAEDHRLRVHFPAPIVVDSAEYDGHFEVVSRELGVPESDETWVEEPRPEVPQRAFTDISDGENGLMIANRGLPEVDVIKLAEMGKTEIALTLIRSVGVLSRDDMMVRQGHAGPALDTPGGHVLGKGTYEYAIIPHAGNWSEAFSQAYAYETSLHAVETELQEGELADSGSFISHSPAEFVISTVKESEDRDGWIIRGYNISSGEIQLNLKPNKKFTHAAHVNLAEERIQSLNIAQDGSVTLPVSGHKIVSIKFSN